MPSIELGAVQGTLQLGQIGVPADVGVVYAVFLNDVLQFNRRIKGSISTPEMEVLVGVAGYRFDITFELGVQWTGGSATPEASVGAELVDGFNNGFVGWGSAGGPVTLNILPSSGSLTINFENLLE